MFSPTNLWESSLCMAEDFWAGMDTCAGQPSCRSCHPYFSLHPPSCQSQPFSCPFRQNLARWRSHRLRHESDPKNKPQRPKLSKQTGKESYIDGLIPKKIETFKLWVSGWTPKLLENGIYIIRVSALPTVTSVSQKLLSKYLALAYP